MTMELTSWHRPFLGLSTFPPDLSNFEIDHFFTLTPDNLAGVKKRRGELHRVAAAVHVGFLRMTGRTLDSFDHIPRQVLHSIGQQLNHPAPDLSTLRALYTRPRTLYEHQDWAMRQLGFKRFNDRRQRVLTTQLNKDAQRSITIAELAASAHAWLYTRKILIPSRSRIDRLVRKIRITTDRLYLRELQRLVPDDVRANWVRAVLSSHTSGEKHLEWLQKPPKKRADKTLLTALEKRQWLMDHNAHHYDLSTIPLIQQQHYARRIRQRATTRFRADAEPRRSVMLECFLHVTLLQLTDIIISLSEMKLLTIKRNALQQVLAKTHHDNENNKALLRDIRVLLEDNGVSDADVRGQLWLFLPKPPELCSSEGLRGT